MQHPEAPPEVRPGRQRLLHGLRRGRCSR
jgi:hypothetical protein